MSFLSKLQQVGNTVGAISHIVAPVVGTFVPGAKPLFALADVVFNNIQDSVVAEEAKDPTPGHGAQKLQNVVAEMVASLESAQADAAAKGLKFTYDIALLQAAISSQVASLNAVATFKDSFKTEPITSAHLL